MTDAESLSDDYVASLLAKDAKESSIKYSALGMEAFSPSKAPENKPKPNTRFLRNIIKETDNHNAALLAKEAAESRARLKNLVTKDSRSVADIRRRQLGHIAAHLTGRSAKRRRAEDEETKSKQHSRRQNTPSEDEEKAHKKSHRKYKEGDHDDRKDGRDKKGGSSSHHRSHRRRTSLSDDRLGTKHDRPEHNSRARPRSRSPNEHRNKGSRHRHRSSERYSARRSSRLENEDDEREHKRPRRRRSSLASKDDDLEKQNNSRKDESTSRRRNILDDDSDPLDDIIGPQPAPTPKIRSRGRGTTSAASGIDLRFSANYDPTVDVQVDPEEEDDWDQALEALRDRQKWRQQGADRLRAAGFTEEEIGKWEKGGEKKAGDVKWAKKGEGREWDRGKVFESDGEEDVVKDIDLNYGRLKGT